ncbi:MULTISPECIES: catechol 1,2-dioxygenase [Alteromonadaceae]|uniref:catechol 1,2-dioxygenase n=1 Tax=Alteromonadaceae TaxID=72275 RepID=UPI00310353A6
MSVKTMQTEAVQTLLKKAAGLDKEGGNPRFKTIMHRFLSDIYQMIEDLDITPEEFWQGANYLNELGTNKEAVLLAPGLGFDHYLDIREDAKDELAGIAGGTPRTIEGPLYVEGAPIIQQGEKMDDGKTPGQEMLLHGRVTDEEGNPIADAMVDIWHADTKGAYSYFDPSQSEFNLRRRIRTDKDGKYVVRSIVPSGYGCPPGGSTMKVLENLGRHGNRPAHIHYFVSKPNFKHLTSQINLAGDEYTYDDFAFATRDELVVDANPVNDAKLISEHGFAKEYLDVEFNIELVKTTEESIQQAHPRARVSLEQA